MNERVSIGGVDPQRGFGHDRPAGEGQERIRRRTKDGSHQDEVMKLWFR
ncbi:MAG: hypothetical protein IPP16_18400 [Acidimicrobiaceae bacterium]|nr:hypothetical protein [Acidimicrobiaceae bacterium]